MLYDVNQGSNFQLPMAAYVGNKKRAFGLLSVVSGSFAFGWYAAGHGSAGKFFQVYLLIVCFYNFYQAYVAEKRYHIIQGPKL